VASNTYTQLACINLSRYEYYAIPKDCTIYVFVHVCFNLQITQHMRHVSIGQGNSANTANTSDNNNISAAAAAAASGITLPVSHSAIQQGSGMDPANTMISANNTTKDSTTATAAAQQGMCW
jgi:hypothetical protein